MKTAVVGRIARRCAWCKTFRTEADKLAAEMGSPISDGICKSCRALHFAGLEERREESK